MSKNDMVMVPRELLERLKNASSYLGTHIEASEGIKTSHYANADAAREILAKPTQQHQGEPLGWVRPQALEALKDVGWVHVFAAKGGDDSAVAVYTHADPAEVERLRAEVAKFRGYCVDLDSGERELEHKMDAYKGAAQEAAAQRAQLAEAQALLREVVDAFKLEPDGSCINPGREFIRPWSAKLAALSASAEPSAPACLTCKGSGLEYDSGAAHPCTDCKSSAPVEIDERAENSERYLWLKENVTGGSLGIPGGWIDDETEHWDRIIDTERKP